MNSLQFTKPNNLPLSGIFYHTSLSWMWFLGFEKSEKEVCRNKETGPYYWAGIALRRSFFLESNLKPFAVTMKMYHIYFIFFFKKKVISFLPSSHKLISFYHGKCIKWLPINSCPSLILQEKQQKPTQISPGDFAISDLCYSYFHKTMGGIYLFQFGSPKPKVQTMNHVGQCPSPLLSLLRSALAVGVSRS